MHAATAFPSDRSCATDCEASALRARATGGASPPENRNASGSGWSSRTLAREFSKYERGDGERGGEGFEGHSRWPRWATRISKNRAKIDKLSHLCDTHLGRERESPTAWNVLARRRSHS